MIADTSFSKKSSGTVASHWKVGLSVLSLIMVKSDGEVTISELCNLMNNSRSKVVLYNKVMYCIKLKIIYCYKTYAYIY